MERLFSTSLYCEQLHSRQSAMVRELRKECAQIQEYDEEGRAWSHENYVGGYTSYSSLCSLHQMSSTFMKLEQSIASHVRRFSRQLDFDLCGGSLRMGDCWINVMPAHVAHGLHIHPLGCISGTYYVSAPRGAPGIKFEDPRIDRFMAAPPRRERCKKENRTHVSYEPIPGRLVLFESWLRHEVPAGTYSGERVSISFNYHWERE
ncbi:MAG: hypothetical protein KDD64_16385 [Bdellovibrionales bacterium]|nr:hypothetical protein [Bdellovibrionales bacterium]